MNDLERSERKVIIPKKDRDNMKYDDIINLPHHVSIKRKQMSMEARAAQFSPFAALTGYDEELDEVGRITEERQYLDFDEQKRDEMDRILKELEEHSNDHPEIEIKYFVPDKLKDGGEYVQFTGHYKRVDISDMSLHFTEGKKVFLSDIIEIVKI